MEFTWLNIRNELITQELLDDFKSGNSVFDEFLCSQALTWQDYSESATYVFVTTADLKENKIQRIYGYVSINATGLMYTNSAGNRLYLPCAEIRMFAIHQSLRKHNNPTIKYSEILFKLALQELYCISTQIIGFRAIFLNANNEGYHLYKNCGFEEVKGYLSPEEEEKLDIEGTTPLILMINDNITDVLFC